MTIEECYQEMGGSYAEVCTRLPSISLVEKFMFKFLETGVLKHFVMRWMPETGRRLFGQLIP